MVSNKLLAIDDPIERSIRRSSSLQFPLHKNNQSNLIQALSNIPSSTVSLYTSTMSVTGFLGMRGSDSAINLYTLMAKYRCCCGFCRLRVGSFAIALMSACSAILVIVLMGVYNYTLTPLQHEYLVYPTFVLMTLQLLCSVFMLIGIFVDSHIFLMPFAVNCVINMMGAMGLGLVLLISGDQTNSKLYPVFASCSMVLVAVYLWFLVICCMTLVMIRDKKRLVESDLNFIGIPQVEPHMERVNSALF